MGQGRPAWLAVAASVLCGLAFGAPALAQTALAQPFGDPVDYGRSASWLCRPDDETNCTTGLDAVVVRGDGQRSALTFTPAVDPPVDCFYVYPTISREPAPFSDMTAGPEEVEVLKGQAARLSSRCRMFAPLYRQLTFAGLRQELGGGAKLDTQGPYRDVLAAWRWYMGHENRGRGVVLIGHSQGAILLQRLIAEEIDGRPAQARLVSAFLAGDPSLPVLRGRGVGGAFKHVPLCASAAQTGCVYVWASYLADDASPDRHFGRAPGGDLVAACDSPASPGGGRGELKAFLPKPALAPASDPHWVEVVGQLSAECVADAQGDVLRITVEPSAFSDLLHTRLHDFANLGEGWGLHRLDLSLPQGNIVDVVGAEAAAWTASGR